MAERVSGNGKQLCSCQCHPDFSWMKFGDTRIHPTDVDCLFVVERRGHFLWLEWKEVDEPLTEGQRILMEHLGRVPKFEVILVRGFSGNPTTVERVTSDGWGFVEDTDKEKFQTRLDEWFGKANS